MLQTTEIGSFSAKSSPPNNPPIKQAYSGEREYLFPHEVEELIKAARHVGRHGLRDATIILLMFRHGLRSAELVALKWSSVDLQDGYLAAQGHDTRAIQDYLGHRNIQHTVRYTQLNPSRFENFWID